MKLKKVLLPIMAGALALALAACGNKEKAEPEKTTQTEQKESAEAMRAKLAEQQVDKDKIVAIVNDEELTGADYNEALISIQGQMQQMGQDPTAKETAELIKMQSLDMLVNRTLILQKAKEADLKASTTEIDKEYSAVEKQFGGEKELQKVLKSEGIDTKKLKEQIANSIVFEKYIEKVAPAGKVTDKEIKEYYDKFASSSKESGQKLPPLDEVKNEIEKVIKQQHQQKLFAKHVEELKAAAHIELKL